MALFTAAEAKAFRLRGETPLASYSDTELTDAAARIKESFEDICGVAFEPTNVTAVVDGSGKTAILLPNLYVTSVTGVTVDGTALTAGELADLSVYQEGVIHWSSGWTTGNQNVSVAYTHGYAAVPKRIKWAALVVAVEELTGNDISSRAITQTDDMGTFRLSTPDGVNRFYGIPSVDAVLAQYSEKVPAIG